MPTYPALAGLLLALACAAATAQTPEAGDAPPARTIVVQNLAVHPRQQWQAVTVPFAEGAVADLPELRVEGHVTVWHPIGARWQDGSLRHAACLFRPKLAPMGERHLALVEEHSEAPEGEIALPPAKFAFTAVSGGKTTTAQPQFVRWLEENAARKVALLRCRIGETGLVGELIVECWAGQALCDVALGVFFSDPTVPDLNRAIDELVLEVSDMALLLHNGLRLGVAHQMTATGNRLILLRKTTLGDGQGIRRTGVLLPPMRGDGSAEDRTALAAAICPPLGATRWDTTGAFGPFGFVPEVPPWLRGPALRPALAGRHRRFVTDGQRPGDPFRAFAHGLARFAGQTGDQRDFGIAKLEPVAATGLPSFLLEVEPAVLQEACRPVHFFETDGAPIRAADHPRWVVWAGRTHWHCGVSADRLGKKCPEPKFETHGWTGKDRQHWSSNYLCAYYLLTGKHWALREIENEVQLYLSGQTVDPALTTSGAGAPRGAGRVLHTASWLYLCTGDAALRERIEARLDQVYGPGWAGRDLPEDRVRPYGVGGPDGRLLDGKTPNWTPWQDSLAAIGFEAAHRVTGNRKARELARAISVNALRFGWRVDDTGAIIAAALKWNDNGVPLTEAELGSGAKAIAQWSTGTAYSTWSIGAVELARGFAEQSGDAAMVDRATRILEFLRSRRSRPTDGWFDRFAQWDAVR